MCSCRDGFRKLSSPSSVPGAENSPICVDINECLDLKPERCSGRGSKCTNNLGSFNCECTNVSSPVQEFDYTPVESNCHVTAFHNIARNELIKMPKRLP